MSKYYTTVELWVDDVDKEISKVEHLEIQNELNTFAHQVLPTWQAQLGHQVERLDFNLSDKSDIIQILVTTNGDLADDTADTMTNLVMNTFGVDMYPNDDFVIQKAIKDLLDADVSIQWADDLSRIQTDKDVQSFTHELDPADRQWLGNHGGSTTTK